MNIKPLTQYNHYADNRSNGIDRPVFKGRIDVLKYALNPKKTHNSHFFKEQVSCFLGINKGLSKYTKAFKRYKMDFLYNLAEKFNCDKQTQKIKNLRETKNLVFEIYNKVKYPEKIHNTLIKKSGFTFEQLDNIVNLTTNNKHNIKLTDKLMGNFPDISYETLESFLKSPISKEIEKNYKRYEPFIQLNIKDPSVAENLEKEIKKGFRKEYFKAKLKIQETKNSYSIFNNINSEYLLKGYSPEKINILEELGKTYSVIAPQISENSGTYKKIFESLYDTTTSHSAPYRKKVLRFIQKKINFENREKDASIEKLAKIFTEINKNEAAREFLNTFTFNDFGVEKKAYIRTLDDLYTAMIQVPEKTHKTPLNQKFVSKAKNTAQKLISALKPKRDNTLHFTAGNIPFSPSEALIPKTKAFSAIEKTGPSLPIALKKNRAVINEVNKIVEKHLNKVNKEELGWQTRDFALKANKTRLSLLESMFKSVKRTRQADKLAGRKPSVSNKDVLALYEALNGRNKKVVMDLLTKPNNDGTYMDIKAITKIAEHMNKTEHLQKLNKRKTIK